MKPNESILNKLKELRNTLRQHMDVVTELEPAEQKRMFGSDLDSLREIIRLLDAEG